MAFDSSLLRKVERDVRLDFFRGIGLWMCFLDHVPHDVIAWLTLRNYGFSDAAEFFVFISGYLIGWIHAPIVRGGLFLASAKRLWMRTGQLYIAHIMLFLIFTAQIARAARKFDNPMYENEFNVFNFLQHPDILIGQALTLRYKPVNLDVLPLYVSLVLISPLVLWCLVKRPTITLVGSVILYILARYFDWNLPSYPQGATWYFNPFCWQLLFVVAMWCGAGGVDKIRSILRMPVVLGLASAWLLFAFIIVMTWHAAWLEAMIPNWMIKAIYPIDKTDLDMLRFTHFLALATIVTYFVPRNWSLLKTKWVEPLLVCGRHSLPIFCLGVFLSFSAHWILTQYSKGVAEQLFVSLLGMVIMTAVAWVLDRAKQVPALFVDVPVIDGPETAAGEAKTSAAVA
jgi:hypothetical protein